MGQKVFHPILFLIVMGLWVCLPLGAAAQSIELGPTNTRNAPKSNDKETIGLSSIMDLDVRLIYSIQSLKDASTLPNKLMKWQDDALRLLDSVDYAMIGPDTLLLVIYAQNHVYTGSNQYKLVRKRPLQTDSPITIDKVSLDMDLKPQMEDYQTFTNRGFTWKIIEKTLPNSGGKRVVVDKTYVVSPAKAKTGK